MADAIIVSFEQQTFNDALHFLERADGLTEDHVFERWSYFTWTIVAADTCMESYLNSFITAKLKEQSSKIFDDIPFNFDKKINLFIEQVLTLVIDKSDKGWQDIKDTVQLRNKILHHKTSSAIFNELNRNNAEKAINACRELVKKLHKAEGAQHPTWIDKTKSENYDKHI